jgi:HlyD family secretion protein
MNPDETKPETTQAPAATGGKPAPPPSAPVKTAADLAPQIVKRVHEFYEALGREEVRAVLAWESAQGEAGKREPRTQPEPDANPGKTKPGSEAGEPGPDPKAAKPKTAAKTGEPEPEAKSADSAPKAKRAETKLEAKTPEPASGTKSVARKSGARNTVIFTLSALGLIAGLVGAYIFGRQGKAQPPVFNPVSSPYDSAIFANGIIESDQSSGANINMFPEVSGPVTKVLAREGERVTAGAPLFTIDDSVQRATTEQLRLQAEAALSLLEELKAQPRMETLAIAASQVGLAESNLKVARDQYDKDRASYDIDPKSISKNALDTAKDATDQAVAALDVARKQYDLTKAGAWIYDIANQEKQYEALKQSYLAANALLVKYSVKAPIDGVVLAINATAGSYVSSQGAYDPYTQLFDPAVMMGPPQDHLAVRCFVDEILVSRLPTSWHIRAEMTVRGAYTNKVPLVFVRVQPYVSPKIELSNERQEQVDLRVLPVIFRFDKKDAPVYPGQLVDVYIGTE